MTNRTETGGLDDLFAMAEEPAVEERVAAAGKPRSRALWIIRNLLLIAVATVVTVAVLRSAGVGISVPLVVVAFVALRLLLVAVAEVAPPQLPKRGDRRTGADAADPGHPSGPDSLRSAVRGWEQRLEWSRSEPDAFSRNVAPVLGELVDERLRLYHGITRDSDPRRARELIGEPVWQMLSGSGRRPPRAGDLAAYVETLERLGEGMLR